MKRRPPGRHNRRAPRLVSRVYGFIALALVAGGATVWQYTPVGSKAPLVALFSPTGLSGAVTHSASRPFPICATGARVDCIVDGDTFWIAGEKVRIADIDTPEVFSPSCRAEKALGKRATRRLHALLNAGPIELRRSGRDRDVYGRLLRTVYRDGQSLGGILVAEGLAHRWVGHKQSWCG